MKPPLKSTVPDPSVVVRYSWRTEKRGEKWFVQEIIGAWEPDYEFGFDTAAEAANFIFLKGQLLIGVPKKSALLAPDGSAVKS